MIHTPKNGWQVNLPNVPDGSFNFSFSANLPTGLFGFEFLWFNGLWNMWVTLPTGEIRQAGVFANSVSWTGFIDYYLQFKTSLSSIGQNDLASVTMVVYQR